MLSSRNSKRPPIMNFYATQTASSSGAYRPTPLTQTSRPGSSHTTRLGKTRNGAAARYGVANATRPKTMREQVIESRYKQREALFQNKHNPAPHISEVLNATHTHGFKISKPKATPTSESAASMLLLKTLNDNLNKYVPQSPLKHFKQEINSNADQEAKKR